MRLKYFIISLLFAITLFPQSKVMILVGDDEIIPYQSDALFYLNGEIVTIGENKYFQDKSGNGRNFLITTYDFASDWTVGFPYKSVATISAPAGDTILIQEDVNHYLYAAADSTPNQIPVVSLFQDIDYANKLFCKHASQVVDDNLAEIYQPRVLDIVLYSSTKSGDELTKCQNYYGVPTESLTAKWIDAANGNNTSGDGTKSLPYKTFSKAVSVTSSGGTIYIKTGDLNEACSIANKGINIIGTGYTRNNITGAVSAFYFASNNTDASHLQGIICDGGSARGIYLDHSAISNLTVEKMKITADAIIRKTALQSGLTVKFKYCITKGQYNATLDNIDLESCYIRTPSSGQSLQLYYNLVSKYNTYQTSTTPIKRTANTTSISLFNDKITGSIFLDEAIATVTSVNIDRCTLYPNSSGILIDVVNAANKISWTITNNTITQTYTSEATLITLKAYDVVFTDNNVSQTTDYVISALALTSGKTFSFERNICTSTYKQAVLSSDYSFTADSNIMISNVYSRFNVISATVSDIPATISNNYMVSKAGGGSFIQLGSEYSTTVDGYLNGSDIYNNYFSGPRDWGNDVGSTHALFNWSQQASWHHNYLSGSFLGFVFKSNGGTFANAVYANVIKDCNMSYTIKGIKGTLIYNNISYESAGYDGLTETYVGASGTGGNTTIQNNIFIDSTNSSLLTFESTDDTIGCVIDNNLYYQYENTRVAYLDGFYTFAQWQSEGFDANSFNENPNLISTSLLAPTTPFDGETLDAAYNDGLDITTFWGSSSRVPNVVTKQQTGTWQVGAYVQ